MNNSQNHAQLPQTNAHISVAIPTHTGPRFALPKAALRPTRVIALSALIVYILLPTQFVALIASHPAFTSLSGAGRKVLASLAIISDQPAVSIVAACRNRHASLRHVLPTWLASHLVQEIILIDWNSHPPIYNTPHLPTHSKLKLVRVQNESSWVLSRAYNLAVNLSTSPIILRIDCDYAIQPNILRVHDISALDNAFYAGNWRLARDDDEVHLNGALIISRRHFLDVGGYDERIQTYGWDDDDLYSRLQHANLTKLNISYDHVKHVLHDDSVRAQEGVKFAQVQIDLNRLLLDKLPSWTMAMYNSNASRYQVPQKRGPPADAHYPQLEATYVPKPLRLLLATSDYEDAWTLALGRRLADDHRIPWDVMATMSYHVREQLLTHLFQMQAHIDAQTVQAGGSITAAKPRIIIIHCVGRLSNRLHALTSAIYFAKKTFRVPIVVWEADSQVELTFQDLFEAPDFATLHEFQPKWPFRNIADYDSAWVDFEFYNLVEGEIDVNGSDYIFDIQGKHLYVKSDHAIEVPSLSLWSTGEASVSEIRNLLPQKDVRCCLLDLRRKGVKSAVGVYVESQTQKSEKNAGVKKEFSDFTVDEWSQTSHTLLDTTFSREMRRILNGRNGTTFYVAADSIHARLYLQSKFNMNVVLSTRPECDHERVPVKGELIDILALSQCRRLLGTDIDSFLAPLHKSGIVENLATANGCG